VEISLTLADRVLQDELSDQCPSLRHPRLFLLTKLVCTGITAQLGARCFGWSQFSQAYISFAEAGGVQPTACTVYVGEEDLEPSVKGFYQTLLAHTDIQCNEAYTRLQASMQGM
jgi:hypothetical protein